MPSLTVTYVSGLSVTDVSGSYLSQSSPRTQRMRRSKAQKAQNGFFVVYMPFVAIYLLFATAILFRQSRFKRPKEALLE